MKDFFDSIFSDPAFKGIALLYLCAVGLLAWLGLFYKLLRIFKLHPVPQAIRSYVKRLLYSKQLVCPYCKGNITEQSVSQSCSFCKTMHHKECWKQSAGCAVFGCKGKLTETTDANAEQLVQPDDSSRLAKRSALRGVG